MRRFVSALSGVLLLVGAGALPAFAWPDILVGQPSKLHAGGDVGYYMWSDDDDQGTLHMRTTGPGPRHLFRAVLKTDGQFENVSLIRVEGDDGYQLKDGGKTLEIRFETWDHIDGIDFDVTGATRVDVDANIDRRHINSQRIFLGANNVDPGHNPFTLYR